MIELLSEKRIRELVRRYGSFYIYDREIIDQYTDQLQNDFAGIQFLYSLKANHNPDVAGFILSKGFGADAASLKEVRMGAANGLGQDEIYYSAPGKKMKISGAPSEMQFWLRTVWVKWSESTG